MLPVRFLRDSLDNFFPSSASSPGRCNLDSFWNDWRIPEGFRVDVRTEGEDTVIEAELPGLKKEDVNISVENNILTVSAETKNEVDEEKAHYHLRERSYGKFSRSFKLGSHLDGDNIAANLNNGVLTLTIPTREEAKPRQIEVK